MAKTALWARIAWLAVRAYHGPVRGFTVLRKLLAERSRSQRWTTQKYAHVADRYFWNLYAPGWPSRAFDRYVERELDRVQPFRGAAPALQTAIFAITKRCSLRCEHCCEWAVLNNHEALSTTDLQEIVARLSAGGATQLFLSGGEPLRRFDDLRSLVRQAAADADVWILTSGLGLTRERAQQLRTDGLTGVALSLDHWDADLHDQFRGRAGVYAWVEQAAQSARQAGLVVALSLCPTRAFVSQQNLQRYALTAARLGASFIQILEPKPVGHYAGQDVTLGEDQRRLLEAFADRLNADRSCRELPAVSYTEYSNRRLGCQGAGDRYLYVDTDGALNSCPFCREPAGHALQGDFHATLATLRCAGCPAQRQEVHHG